MKTGRISTLLFYRNNNRIIMDFKLSNYYKPTPVLMRKIGDSLLAISASISGYAIVSEMKWLALTGLVSGIAGKVITNLFAVDTKKNDPPDPPGV